MGIDSLIKNKKFKEMSSLSDDIRKNHNSYIDREVERVNVIGKKLIE